ncbi:MAG TPA: efflux RND transporter periplasmic adaptor subunit [Cellvibrio sp.]
MPDLTHSPLSTRPETSRALRTSGIIIGVAAVLLVALGLSMRAYSSKDLNEWTAAQAITTVAVVSPVKSDANRVLELPGRFEAFATAPIYARVPGYLKNWQVDIGAQVKAGQVLGEIETPDLDQQLLEARADMESAKANMALSESTLKRMQSLLASKVISQQEYENRASDFEAKQAQFQSSKANYERLQVNKRFARITAPFNGVVTERNTDIGALINIGSSASPPLFTISDASKLRLYVNVPQTYSSIIKNGDEANITVPEHQGKTFKATVAASSGAIDAGTSTARLQLTLDNASGELLPGSYARVSFAVQSAAETLSIPASALIFNAAGLQVATVGQDSKVTLKSISITRDLGKSLEINGLLAQDKVIDNPPDGISNGEAVSIKTAKEPG